MLNQIYLLAILKDLSSCNSSIKKSILKNKVFRELKCSPEIYQKTRWLGAINLLLSTKRAYDKDAFLESETVCPVDFKTIEIYIQIILPAQFTTLAWERNQSSIADVIPSVLYLLYAWNKMDIEDEKARELCFFLIHFTREKFKYELESNVYQVS